MKESTLNMYKNLLQLNKLEGCQIVAKKRNCFDTVNSFAQIQFYT